MKTKVSIIYSWLIRTLTYFLPNIPIFMRLRGFLYSFLMKSCGKNFQVAASVNLVSLAGLDIGRDVYIAHNSVLLALNLKIEDEVMIGPNVVIASGNHTRINGSYRFGPYERDAVLIKKGSWVAANCTILSGAVLPKGCILAAGSVLNKEFEIDDYLYGGAPAKPIKQL